MNIQEILSEHRIPFRPAGSSPHVTTGWIGLICPWCGEGTGNYGLGINEMTLSCSCWKCGTHSLYEILTILGISSKIAYDATKSLKRVFQRSQQQKRGKLILPRGIGGLCIVHRAYLRGRGFDPEEIERLWGIQATNHLADFRWKWRLFIPIRLDGETVSFTTRSIGNKDNRYRAAAKNEEIYPRRTLLYGEEYCRHSIAVVEGPTDVWRIGPGATATLGVVFSKEQVARISKYPRRVICYDNDPAAQKRARSLRDALLPYEGETNIAVLESGKDPGEANKEEIAEFRKQFLD